LNATKKWWVTIKEDITISDVTRVFLYGLPDGKIMRPIASDF
jgi:hypothetical protein